MLMIITVLPTEPKSWVVWPVELVSSLNGPILLYWLIGTFYGLFGSGMSQEPYTWSVCQFVQQFGRPCWAIALAIQTRVYWVPLLFFEASEKFTAKRWLEFLASIGKILFNLDWSWDTLNKVLLTDKCKCQTCAKKHLSHSPHISGQLDHHLVRLYLQ